MGGENVRKQLGTLLLVFTIAVGFSGAGAAADSSKATMSSNNAHIHMTHGQMTQMMKSMHLTHNQMILMMQMMQKMHLTKGQMMQMCMKMMQ